jgi:hypothetical protein
VTSVLERAQEQELKAQKIRERAEPLINSFLPAKRGSGFKTAGEEETPAVAEASRLLNSNAQMGVVLYFRRPSPKQMTNVNAHRSSTGSTLQSKFTAWCINRAEVLQAANLRNALNVKS